MNEQYDNQVGREDPVGREEEKYKGRSLTKEEVKELTTKVMRKVKPRLVELGQWRAESLDSKFRF